MNILPERKEISYLPPTRILDSGNDELMEWFEGLGHNKVLDQIKPQYDKMKAELEDLTGIKNALLIGGADTRTKTEVEANINIDRAAKLIAAYNLKAVEG